MKKNSIIREILFYVIILAVIVVVISSIGGNWGSNKPKEIDSYDKFVSYFNAEQVKEVEVSAKGVVSLKLQDGSSYTYKLASFSVFYEDLEATILATRTWRI